MTGLALLELPPGTEVRGFLTERLVGAGGFGTVYRARRGARLYALKFLHRSRAGGWARREVEILMRLAHPNVVGFEGCGFWPDDTREYLVVFMDYVEGRRLDEWAREENPAAREVARKVLGVARALGELHRLGVIHRDLKEQNIIVRASDGEAVVVDFGVSGGTNTVRVTREVLPPCTLEYRSPEAWHFLQENVRRLDVRYQPGPADDLYALGVVLYWLLTGRYPCVGATEAEQAEATLHQLPEPPHVINPQVPEALSALCMRLLEKRPEDRYADAESLGAAVEAALAGADAAWSVPLCEFHAPDDGALEGELARAEGEGGVEHWLREARQAHERPRRGRRPAPAAPEALRPLPAGADAAPALGDRPIEPPEVEPPGRLDPEAGPSGPASTGRGGRPSRRGALNIARWGTAALFLAAGVGLAVAQLGTSDPRSAEVPLIARATEEPRAGLLAAVPETTWEVGGGGWKVAPPWKPPEATGRDFVITEAAALVHAPALHEKGEISVKNPRQKQQKGLGSMGKALRTGVACLGVACSGPGPQVRPTPPAEECPAGALEAMAELGIKVGDRGYTTFPVEGDAHPVTVKEGWNSVRLHVPWEELPVNTLLVGKLSFGGERIFGRFTEARLPGGGTVPVCAELVEVPGGKPGELMEPGSTADDVKVFSSTRVQAVEQFRSEK